jgi:hypothetical protein
VFWLDLPFREGHQLDGKMRKRIPKAMIARRLTQVEATKLLKRLGG